METQQSLIVPLEISQVLLRNLLSFLAGYKFSWEIFYSKSIPESLVVRFLNLHIRFSFNLILISET